MQTLYNPYMVDVKKTRSKTIDVIDDETYNEIQLKAARRGMSLRQYVNLILEWKIKHDKLMKKVYPNITKMANDDGNIVLEDSELNQIARVHLKNEKLFCKLCGKYHCAHVEFARSTLDYPFLFDSGK